MCLIHLISNVKHRITWEVERSCNSIFIEERQSRLQFTPGHVTHVMTWIPWSCIWLVSHNKKIKTYIFYSRHKTRKTEEHALFIVSVYVSSISRKIVSQSTTKNKLMCIGCFISYLKCSCLMNIIVAEGYSQCMGEISFKTFEKWYRIWYSCT
jgi:hypothetical protein